MMQLLKGVVIFFCICNSAFAQKLSLGFGAFSLDAKVGDQKTSISNLGAYKIQYHSKILNQFELIIGYNMLMESIVSGDKAFGPVLGFSFYPLGSQTVSQTSLSNISFTEIKGMNPYVYAGFNQRQYQSIKASYSGFAFGIGTEIGVSKTFAFFSDAQYSLLEGPNSGELSELIISAGIMYNY
jgi:hypothetical protein